MSNAINHFTVDDATYAYEINGQGIPVILLHGFTGSKATWSSLVSKLKDHFQLITIDLPGHGETVSQTPRSMTKCCDDLAKLFKHLQISKFHLIGYSMGGRVALSFATLYPDLIASLTLESASPGIQSEAERQVRMTNDEKLAQQIMADGILKFVDFWENIPLFESQKSMPKSFREAVRNERLTQSEEGLAMSLRAMGTGSQPSLWPKLNGFESPVLLIVGELDEKFIMINQQMKKKFQHAAIITVKNAGHAIHVEKPEKFGKLIKTFILGGEF